MLPVVHQIHDAWLSLDSASDFDSSPHKVHRYVGLGDIGDLFSHLNESEDENDNRDLSDINEVLNDDTDEKGSLVKDKPAEKVNDHFLVNLGFLKHSNCPNNCHILAVTRAMNMVKVRQISTAS